MYYCIISLCLQVLLKVFINEATRVKIRSRNTDVCTIYTWVPQMLLQLSCCTWGCDMWVGYFKLVSAQMLGMFTNDQTDSSLPRISNGCRTFYPLYSNNMYSKFSCSPVNPGKRKEKNQTQKSSSISKYALVPLQIRELTLHLEAFCLNHFALHLTF